MNGSSGWRDWVFGIVGVLLVAGVIGALSQSRMVGETAARNDQRISHLERQESGRDSDHDAIVDMRADLRSINAKLDRLIASLDRGGR